MKQKDIKNFKIWCSEIHSLFSRPKGATMPRKSDQTKFIKLLESDAEKTEEDLNFIRSYNDKVEIYNDPPLSKTTINALIRQYGWSVYNKKTAQKGDAMSFLKKGTDMEAEAVELLSHIDNHQYSLSTDTIENDYLVGRCDVLCREKDLIIDTKISWNVNSFLKARTTPLTSKHWHQVQGYMELYDVNQAEVVFLLLNTPPELIEREKIKLINKFMIGEIDREKYEVDMDNIESAFTYSNIPVKRRYFKYQIKREPQIFDTVYKKVDKARIWIKEFEKSMKKNIFDVPSENYLKVEENNIEHNSDECVENDAGG